MTWLNQLLLWSGLGLSTVVIAGILLAVFAPTVLAVIAEFLKPVAASAGRGIADLAGTVGSWLWAGAKRFLADVFDDWVTVTGLVVCMGLAYYVGVARLELVRLEQARVVQACKSETKTLQGELRKVRSQLQGAEKRLTKPPATGWW